MYKQAFLALLLYLGTYVGVIRLLMTLLNSIMNPPWVTTRMSLPGVGSEEVNKALSDVLISSWFFSTSNYSVLFDWAFIILKFLGTTSLVMKFMALLNTSCQHSPSGAEKYLISAPLFLASSANVLSGCPSIAPPLFSLNLASRVTFAKLAGNWEHSCMPFKVCWHRLRSLQ